MEIWILKLLTVGHIFFAALFVGGNVFMDFLLSPRLELIPPGQAARLGEKLGTDFARYNWICLGGLVIFGSALSWRLGFFGSLVNPTFLTSGYGSALLVKELIWTSLVITGAYMTFYLRPRVIVKLPYDASREEIEADRDATLGYANQMRWLARYNAIAAIVALTAAGFLRQGGLF